MAIDYQTQFSTENIIQLKNAIASAIDRYSGEKEQKLDIFVVLASLSQVAYEISMQTFPRNDQELTKVHGQMRLLSKELIKEIEATRIKEEIVPAAEIIAPIHVMGIVAEHFAKVRDESISKILQDEAVVKYSAEIQNVTPDPIKSE